MLEIKVECQDRITVVWKGKSVGNKLNSLRTYKEKKTCIDASLA